MAILGLGTDIVEIAVAAQDAGADALTLINSLGPGMKINIDVVFKVSVILSGS